ncbi:MAG: hypothetical protein IPG97_17155 [Microthrixaceae bacterium]|nr:hypothetical protein [Microthrixaceae bacterium]
MVPGTSTIRRISLHMVLEPDADNGLDALTAFQPEQVRSVSVDRLQDRIGRAGRSDWRRSTNSCARFSTSEPAPAVAVGDTNQTYPVW